MEWSIDGVAWTSLVLHDGQVVASASSQVRWSCDLTVSGVDVGRFALSPFGCLLRVKIGMVHSPDDVEWVPLGFYRAKVTGQTEGSNVLTLSGQSFEAAVIDDRFYQPRILAPSVGRLLVTQLIRETLPEARVSWRLDPNATTTRIVAQQDRWGTIDGDRDAPSFARSLGGRVFCDADGTFVAAPVPTLQDAPVWAAARGTTLVKASRQLTREGVRNAVIVTGATADGTPPVGPGVAEDLDPLSPTYVGRSPLAGGFGRVPKFYSNPQITDLVRAQFVAQRLLATYLGLQQQVDFEAVPNYALRPDDVVLVDVAGAPQPNLLDEVTYSLRSPSVTAQTRATATRLGGSVSAVPDYADEQGGPADA